LKCHFDIKGTYEFKLPGIVTPEPEVVNLFSYTLLEGVEQLYNFDENTFYVSLDL